MCTFTLHARIPAFQIAEGFVLDRGRIGRSAKYSMFEEEWEHFSKCLIGKIIKATRERFSQKEEPRKLYSCQVYRPCIRMRLRQTERNLRYRGGQGRCSKNGVRPPEDCMCVVGGRNSVFRGISKQLRAKPSLPESILRWVEQFKEIGSVKRGKSPGPLPLSPRMKASSWWRCTIVVRYSSRIFVEHL